MALLTKVKVTHTSKVAGQLEDTTVLEVDHPVSVYTDQPVLVRHVLAELRHHEKEQSKR